MSKTKEAMHGITVKDKIGYAMGDMGGLLTFGFVSGMMYTGVNISYGSLASLTTEPRICRKQAYPRLFFAIYNVLFHRQYSVVGVAKHNIRDK